MKTRRRSPFVPAVLLCLCLLGTVSDVAQGQSVPFTIRFWYPTKGQTFLAPANIGVHAFVLDSNLVETVQYFAGATSLGTVTNSKGLWLTNTSSDNPFFLLWSKVPAENYTLTAVATDSAGIMATSPPVDISVVKPMPPNVPFTIRFWYPTNGQTFLAPANIGVHAFVLDSNLDDTGAVFLAVAPPVSGR